MKKVFVALLLVLSVVLLDHASRDVFSPARAQFAGQSQWGGTSTGTNAIAVTVPNVGSLADLVGVPVWFVAGGSNTTATTLSVTSTTAKNLFRPTPSGPVAMVGGEIVANQLVGAMYDGTQYHLISKPALDMPPGAVFDYAGASGCPAGSLVGNGGSFVTANYPTLNTVLSTTWGIAGTLPDLRGRGTFSADSGGSGRITAAAGNFDGTVVGNTGGVQNRSITTTYLPASAPSFTGTPTTPTFTGNAANYSVAGAGGVYLSSTGGPTQVSSGSGILLNPTTSVVASGTPSGSISAITPAGTIGNLGSGTTFPVLSNAAIVLKCVKG